MEGGQGSEGRGRSALLPVHAGAVQPVKVRVPGQTVLEHRLVRLLVAYDTLICLYRYKDRYIIDDRFGFGFIIYCFHRPRDLDFLHFLMLNYFYHRPLPSLLLTQLPLPFPASDHLICSTAPPIPPPLIPLNAHVCITYHKDILHLIDRPRKSQISPCQLVAGSGGRRKSRWSCWSANSGRESWLLI